MRSFAACSVAILFLLPTDPCSPQDDSRPEFRDPRDPALTLMPLSRFFSPDRPKLIVLIHGLESHSTTDYAGAASYWRKDFLAGLLGAEAKDGAVCEDAKDPVRRHFFVAKSHPGVSVMLTYRDSRVSLAEQAAAAANQVYDLYLDRFSGEKDYPQLILFGHSMGGLVARCLASDSTRDAQPTRSPREATRLQRRLDFLRSRVLCVVTLQTPHQGTPVADQVQKLQSILGQSAMSAAIKQAAAVLGLEASSAAHSVTSFVSDLRRAAVLADLSVTGMGRWNTGDLRPDRARRHDGSLIPVLAIGTRDPSSGFLSHPSRVPVVALYSAEDQQRILQTIALDAALHKLTASPWGRTGDPLCDRIQRSVNFWTVAKDAIQAKAPGRPELRLLLNLGERVWVPLGIRQQLALPLYLPSPLRFVDREVQVSVPTALLPKGLKLPKSFKVSCPLPELGKGAASDGFVDSDGLVSIASALGYEITGEPRGFAHNTYDLTLKSFGSWYRVATADSEIECLSHRPPRTFAVGAWLHQNLFAKVPGPYCSPKEGLPVWAAPAE